jgi:hypothetical protein
MPRPEIEFPLQESKSLDGIISYLTRKHGGNVHDKGIVTITSKSVVTGNPKFAVRNIADLASASRFFSKDEPRQWAYWDFREMLVHPTHYTMQLRTFLKFWVILSSLDGANWTEIDRKPNSTDFNVFPRPVTSFAVSNSAECRFIRLTQTDQARSGHRQLIIGGFQFFGTLLEGSE